ncbi:MAG: four helix bundle protein [Bradymonadaceae bacterium]
MSSESSSVNALDSASNSRVRERLVAFSVRTVRAATSLPNHPAADHLADQLLRSATAPGAHLREANRARSPAEFISKLQTALQELDEAQYWIEVVAKSPFTDEERYRDLHRESDELLAILTTIVKNTKSNSD